MPNNNATNFIGIATQSGTANQATGSTTGFTFTGAGGVTTSASGSTVTITGSGGGSGTIVQQKRVSSTTGTSTATAIAPTTTPTTANTVFLISQSFTPTSASNTLIFTFSCPFANDVGFFLFAGTTIIQSFPYGHPGGFSPIHGNGSFTIYALAGTTSPTTYAIYYAGTGTGTVGILVDEGGTPFYGGNVAMNFIITEVVT